MTTPRWVTGGVLYRRFHGPARGQCYDDGALLAAAGEMRAEARAQGAARLFAYFNNDAGACAPRDATVLRAALAGGEQGAGG
ncbi:MAG TPA: DUF72 domain-containing protein [Bryobacterales bacterium]|nr:DUF72 domain-containing protein [Bryobacterales bacterium]